MLNGLDEVDWSRLTHAYGTAGDVPDQLRALASSDAGDRGKALKQLYGNIYHQGTVYKATAHAVPFLLEVLAAGIERREVLELLVAIVTGYDENWLPGGLPVAQNRRLAAGGDAVLAAGPQPGDEDFDEDEGNSDYLYGLDEDDQARVFAHFWVTAYDAVRAGVPLFRSLLDVEPVMAAYALAWFPEEAPGSLRALAEVTGDDAAVAAASVAIGLLGGRPVVALGDPRPLARWGAAIALAGPDAADDVVEELLTVAAGSLGRTEEVPFLDGDLAGYAALALRQTGDRHADRVFDVLVARLPGLTGLAVFPVLREVLRLAFPDGALTPGTPYTALDSRQRRIVEALTGIEGIWLVNLNEHLRAYGLPTEKEALRAYASTR
ncbi:hypothetical protein [Lentzea sp. NPDC060358]|uniref:hypothetical protein n=1 Tax=Lentzea sp. NPDC060358 TaxID=3347103 RepID=UPI0036639D9D